MPVGDHGVVVVAKATTVPASTASAAGKVSATSAALSVSNEVAMIEPATRSFSS